MPLRVVKYSIDWKERWDRFVLHSNNGTLFHLQTFLEYHPAGRFKWHHLLFLEGDKIIAVLPAAEMGTTLESPIGASYGSFVTEDIPFAKSLELVDAFSEYCREQQFERALLTAPPFIYQDMISQNIDYALAYRGFAYDKHYISHAIRLNDTDMVERFQSTARRYIHKHLRERTLSVEQSDDYEAFYPILLKNKARHGVKPTHTLEELLKLRALLPDRFVLFLVKKDRKPIAGSLVFVCNSQVALCFYNMLLYEYEQYNPIHVVMHEVVRWAQENGFRWVDIGVSQDTKANNPMTPALGLIKFKEKFNARGILRSTFYKRFL
ncbi:MAG TPA: GNAT family N-acetyltransferase [Bacteroidota bacterium]|nr:GNAT family N-acetyltransferase [Bacteroidota bacterium]